MHFGAAPFGSVPFGPGVASAERAAAVLAGGGMVVRTLSVPIKRRRGQVGTLRPFAEADEFRVLEARLGVAPTRQTARLAALREEDEFAALEGRASMRVLMLPLSAGSEQISMLRGRPGVPAHALLEEFMRKVA